MNKVNALGACLMVLGGIIGYGAPLIFKTLNIKGDEKTIVIVKSIGLVLVIIGFSIIMELF